MKKKKIANIVMVAVIIAIAISGILGVGHIKGWFDKSDEKTAVLTDFRGIITLQRDGVAYATTDKTVLRKGDKITCDPGATVRIALGENYIALGQNADAEIINPDSDEFALKVNVGEAFVNTSNSVSLEFADKQTEISNSVATLSVRKGAQSISVYQGSVGEATEGQMLEWIGDKESVRNFSVKSLNDFNISQIRKANETNTLVFSNDDLDKLENERWEQMHGSTETTTSDSSATETVTSTHSEKTAGKETTSSTTEKKEPTATVASSEKTTAEKTTKKKSSRKRTTRRDYSLYITSASTTAENKTTRETKPDIPETTTKPDETTEPETTAKSARTTRAATTKQAKTTKPVTKKTTTTKPTTAKPTTTKPVTTTKPTTAKPTTTKPATTTTEPVETTKEKLTCTITIRCDTILNNMDNLDPAKAPYVPDDGVILREVTVEFEEGETVFDVLNRVCKQYNIPIEYSWTPMYDSYYIEGINNLYEFDCGTESGWMYKVNGWFPNYGCSSYYLTGGEKIVWCYTCNGLGEDVGAERWE